METGTILFGRYLLFERISQGTLAEVWLASRQGREGYVAIKRLRPALAKDAALQALFVNEAKVAVQLAHPNIAQVYDLGLANGDFYIELEYLAGADLRAVLTRSTDGVMPWELAAHVAAQLCDALDHVHRKQGPTGLPLELVHRDVAPDNVMLTFDGGVKLVDFSAAAGPGKLMPERRGRSAYYSPELLHCQTPDRRSDVYSVGVLLYEALTGRRLAAAPTEPGATPAHCCKPVLPPRAVNRDIPADLERIVLTALAHDRTQRYQWASELAGALHVLLGRQTNTSGPAGLQALMKQLFPLEIAGDAARSHKYARGAAKVADAPRRGPGAHTFEFEIDEGLMAQVVPHPTPPVTPARPPPEERSEPTLVLPPELTAEAIAAAPPEESPEAHEFAQRRANRWTFAVPVRGVWGVPGKLSNTLEAVLVNLSTSGALLRTAEDVPIPVDAEVGFTIPLRLHNMIALAGVVRWTRFSPGGRELGVEFSQPHPELLVLHRTK